MIEPKILKGFKDTLPEIMIIKKKLIKKLEKTFENFGFLPIDTPALEYTEILLGKGGGETDKQIYRFRDHGGRDVALRYDLTVPLARFVAANYNELIFPFKRYHIAPVWRGENTQKGRYREFYQCDFDILGENSINADLEILLLIKNGFDQLNISDYTININHRKLLYSFLEQIGFQDNSIKILRTIDKIYKIGKDGVIKELVDNIKISLKDAENIINFLNIDKEEDLGIREEKIFETLDNFKNILTDTGKKAVEELTNIFNNLKKLNILKYFTFNPAITRGLDYYTGIVFESFINDRIEFGSVCSGGRYDNLTRLYSKNIITGVGGSFGLDRLIALLESKNILKPRKSITDVIIFNLDNNLLYYYNKAANILRKNDIKTEIIFEPKKIVNQFKIAEKKGIEYVIIAGEEEANQERFNLKNIKIQEEKKNLTIQEIIKIIKGK